MTIKSDWSYYMTIFSSGNARTFYLEDMILVTTAGHEVLSSGLPYSAAGVADMMQQR